MLVVGKVMKLHTSNDRLPRSMWSECINLYTHAEKISPRLRSYFKLGTGPGEHRPKTAWSRIQQLSSELHDYETAASNVDVEAMAKLTVDFKNVVDAKTEGDLHDVIVDLFNERLSMVEAIGHVSSQTAFGDDPSDKRRHDMATDICNNLLVAVDAGLTFPPLPQCPI